jgi:hypothetical protein
LTPYSGRISLQVGESDEGSKMVQPDNPQSPHIERAGRRISPLPSLQQWNAQACNAIAKGMSTNAYTHH